MNEMNKNVITVALSGRIDSGNATEIEADIRGQLGGHPGEPVILDAEKLEYISSAGLRVILRLVKEHRDLKITGVSSEIYEIFEMTGFTEMMTVEKAYRTVSVEGCEVIGEGFNGKVYRIDRDNVVKTYKNADALSEIKHEREVAKLALILGVPTAISYDVVRVGDSYGSVFELLEARSFTKILIEEPERMDFCVKEYVKMLKKIHSIEVPEGKLPKIKEKVLRAVTRVKDTLPDGLGDKLLGMVEAIPDSDRMIHGDCHTKNIVLAGDEVLLIDMDTLSVGDPIFEFLYMYNAYVGYSEYDPGIVLDFQGYDATVAREFWHRTLAAYFETDDEAVIKAVEEKIRCVAYPYLLDWSIRHSGEGGEKEKATVALWRSRLVELLGRVDDLDLGAVSAAGRDPDELNIEAVTDNLDEVINFVNGRLEICDCSPKAQMQMDLAVEEIFVNIANYAYAPDKGRATVRVEVSDDPVTVTITFTDRGVPYDPLKKDDPDVTLPAGEREVGGLGIFLTKQIMDDLSYEYRDGQNILTLKKKL